MLLSRWENMKNTFILSLNWKLLKFMRKLFQITLILSSYANKFLSCLKMQDGNFLIPFFNKTKYCRNQWYFLLSSHIFQDNWKHWIYKNSFLPPKTHYNFSSKKNFDYLVCRHYFGSKLLCSNTVSITLKNSQRNSGVFNSFF